ncbi:alpha/beta fold hydrolase [Dactylosporangium sp. CA-152071]|uniref:alpha/beta fold hydrolase n=1 Tax=Dactylosporangium sp. CA-152071 TaxID=3239933 RepID=UPI003D937C4A
MTDIARLRAGPVEYRLERRSAPVVLLLHGGHMRAGLSLGEDVFDGHTLLVPSRPGYGRTPLSTGTTPVGFADAARDLCEHIGITSLAAVVGVSGGGPTAVAMAARHPGLVRRLVLQSAVGPLPWPDRRTRLGAHVVFAPRLEGATWAQVRRLLHRAPDTVLKFLLDDLSTLPAEAVLRRLAPADRAALIDLFTRMRSGHGFVNDLRPSLDLTGDVSQPALVIATRNDGAVPFAHAEALTRSITHAELVESDADSHFVWFGTNWPAVTDRVRRFLAS